MKLKHPHLVISLSTISIALMLLLFIVDFAKPQVRQSQTPVGPGALVASDDALSLFLEQNGAKITIQTLFELSTQSGFDCHQRAHTAGRLAYKIFGAEKAFRDGSGECHSGYYHGTTEGYFADNGTANLNENLKKLCSADLNPFFRHQCYHGVGHGLMGWSSYEINEALASCELLENGTDQGSCTTGVFMENFTGTFQDGSPRSGGAGQSQDADHTSKYLSNDPHYPCNIVEDKHKSNCYFLQTSRMLQILGNDFKKIANECQKAPDAYQPVCFASMGRDVGGQSRGNPKKSIEYCSFAPKGDLRTQCLLGAIQDYFWDPTSANSATNFCRTLTDTQEKSACYAVIIGRALDVLTTIEAKNNFCPNLETNYQDQCRKTIL